MIQVSVIVPVFNGSAWIDQCVDSLLNQDFDPRRYEIIIVDNNSTDGSGAIACKSPRIQLFREPQQGSYFARNTGIRHSSGAILAFTDADCVPEPGWLTAIDRAMRDESVQVMLGSRRYAAPSRTLHAIAAYEDARVQYIIGNRRQTSLFGFTNNMAVRRGAFERCGPFDTVARGGDTLLVQRVASCYGPTAIAWNPAMRISHLELRNGRDFLRKNFLYARARRNTSHLGQCETLSLTESLRIFLDANSGRSGKFASGVVLAAGRITFAIGLLL
jgi:glycosyltransferase involved in cell wall biosynthesis